MCIVFFTLGHPGYRLILAANRDEFLDRPTSPAKWHDFDGAAPEEQVLSGRDLGTAEKGTWLGITKDLRVGTVTNIRFPIVAAPPDPPSRGMLLKTFLSASPEEKVPVSDFLKGITAESYVGFNLLLFDLQRKNVQVGYLSNRPEPTQLTPSEGSCQGISNSPWDQPYPKVTEGEDRMTQTLEAWSAQGGDEDDLVARMMDLLSPAPPVTSAKDLFRATRVRPVIIGSDPSAPPADSQSNGGRWYGTRVSTVIVVRDDGHVIFVERDIALLNQSGQVQRGDGERRVTFQGSIL